MIKQRLYNSGEQENHRNDAVFSVSHHIRRYMSVKLSTANVYLDHLVKLVPAGSLRCKFTVFPFKIYRYLEEDILRL